MNATLPKEWGQGDLPKEIPEGQELAVILLDIGSSFSVSKFAEKLRDFYSQNDLFSGNDTSFNAHATSQHSKPKAGACPSSTAANDLQAKAIDNDKSEFIKTVLKNLYIYECRDTVQFNLAVRSLPSFFRTNKNVGMVVVDGLQYIEVSEYLYAQEKKIHAELMKDRERKSNPFSGGRPGAGPTSSGGGLLNTTTVMNWAEEIGDDVPSMEDFFLGAGKENKNRENIVEIGGGMS